MADEALFIDGTDFRAGLGKFDARKRYLRAGNTLSNFPVVRGATTSVSLVSQGAYNVVFFRFSVAGYVRQSSIYGSGTFNADYTLVTT